MSNDEETVPESSSWASYSRQGLSIASAATSLGFLVALKSTQFGFTIARGVTTTAVSVGSKITDHIIYGEDAGTGESINAAVTSCLSMVESIATAPIHLGQTITTTSLLLASSSLDALPNLFGSVEASYSLSAFVDLVKREWQSPVMAHHLPEKRYSVVQIARSLVAWAAIQSVTTDWAERRWLSAENVEEVNIDEWMSNPPDEEIPMVPMGPTEDGRESVYSMRSIRSRKTSFFAGRPSSGVTITSDIFLPDNGGEILVADIGEPDNVATYHAPLPPPGESFGKSTYSGLRFTVRRLSRMVLGGYGGAGLLFFGVPLPQRRPTPADTKAKMAPVPQDEQTSLVDVVNAAEQDEEDSYEQAQLPGRRSRLPSMHASDPTHTEGGGYSWWDTITGKHDQELFESFAFDKQPSQKAPSAISSQDARFPRFWILTDHFRRQIVLVLRGTMSLNEVAIDLTCESMPFTPASAGAPSSASHLVHSGMLQLAQSMGLPGKSLHLAIRTALLKNRGYELVLCGHSLGAGVAALLALMWADPTTCSTVRAAGLPSGRRVSAYCFAPPCVSSTTLSQLSSRMITSFVYSYDVVSRLSLGAVRDLIHASSWLCHGKENPEDSCQHIVSRALLIQRAPNLRSEEGDANERAWFLSLRKTLEANMQMTELYPPGKVFWAVWNKDLHPTNQLPKDAADLRLFRVKKVDKVFSQIVFARDMMSSHMPHLYDGILHENL